MAIIEGHMHIFSYPIIPRGCIVAHACNNNRNACSQEPKEIGISIPALSCDSNHILRKLGNMDLDIFGKDTLDRTRISIGHS